MHTRVAGVMLRSWLAGIGGAIVLLLGLLMRVVLVLLGRHMHTRATKALQQLLNTIRDTGAHIAVVKAQSFRGLCHLSCTKRVLVIPFMFMWTLIRQGVPVPSLRASFWLA